jgi:hypothetical protein
VVLIFHPVHHIIITIIINSSTTALGVLWLPSLTEQRSDNRHMLYKQRKGAQPGY